jgi:hypothetical protein
MHRCRCAIASALLLLLPGTNALAQGQSGGNPSGDRVLRMTGVLRAADGSVLGPVETVTYSIYDQETGGSPLWQETQNVNVDAQGRYSLLLGAVTRDGVPPGLFVAGESRWVGVQWTGHAESSRYLLTTAPYALNAASADTLAGRPVTDFVLSASAKTSTLSSSGGTGTRPVGIITATAGTGGRISKFINSTDLGDSVMFESGGRIGLGTTTPLDFFHSQFTNTNGAVTGLAVQNLGSTATSYSGMLFYDQNGALGQFQGFNNSTHEYRINNIASGGTINFMIGSSSKFHVANNGHIGIGGTAPIGTEKLAVIADTNRGIWSESISDFAIIGDTTVPGDTGGTAILGQAGTGVGVWAFSNSGLAFRVSGGGSVQATFEGNGSVGIGTTTPADKLDVAGDIRVGTGTTGCVKDADGTVITGVCSSDRRFKQQIMPFASSLEKVTRLQPVTFRWRSDEFPDKHFGVNQSFGLIAQDVEEVLPELVTTDGNGYKAVKYNLLPFHMLQAIKDLKSENDDLKARLAALEAALATLIRQ